MAASIVEVEPETIIFNSRFCGRKNVKKHEFPVKNVDTKDNDNPTTKAPFSGKNKIFDIKKARYEIIKFGLTGFNKEQQTDAKIAMAIKLGAKPPKKKPVNYKILMEQKKKEKEAIKNAREHRYTLQPLKQRKKSNKKKKVKNQPNSLV